MKQNTKKPNDVKFLIYLAIVSVAIFFVLCLLKTNVDICEWWTKNVSGVFVAVSGFFTDWFAVSLFEIFLILAVVWIIITVVNIIKSLIKKEGKYALKLLLLLFCFAFIFLDIYIVSASFAYNRKQLEITLYQDEMEEKDVYLFAQSYVKKLNELATKLPKDKNGAVICPYSLKELSHILDCEYAKLNDEFGDYLTKYTPRAKSSIFSFFMSEMHIVGMFFAPTAEIQVNTHCPSYDIDCTVAHEMAHGKGVMRENEANLLSYYVMLNSDDDYVLFSVMYSLLNQVLTAVSYYQNSQPQYDALVNSLSQDVIMTSKHVNEFWSEHDFLKEIEEFFNNQYLKLNGVENGTDSYVENNKADIIVDEDNFDDYGEPIVQIISFSNVQKLLFLFNQKGTFN